MNLNTKLILLIIFFQITVVKAQSQIENYLNTPSSLKIDNKDYNLVWSSNPDKNYFKQEYLTSEQKLEKYNKMVLIEFVKGDLN